jgi:hypothetical protein
VLQDSAVMAGLGMPNEVKSSTVSLRQWTLGPVVRRPIGFLHEVMTYGSGVEGQSMHLAVDCHHKAVYNSCSSYYIVYLSQMFQSAWQQVISIVRLSRLCQR